MKKVKVKLLEEDRQQCIDFAKKVYGTNKSHYSDRNQNDPKIIKSQNVIGKLGEIAVYRYISLFISENISYPDFKIYKSSNKSFKQDMIVNGYKIHVKSQSEFSANRFGLSWMFQNSGKGYGHHDSIIDKPDKKDLVAFVKINDDQTQATIYGIVKACKLTENKLYSKPVKNDLKGIKKVIYYDDIEEKGKKFLWSSVTQVARKN